MFEIFFIFDEKFYEQRDGVAMVSRLTFKSLRDQFDLPRGFP